MKDLSLLKVLLVSHVSDLSGPTEALEDFLKKRVRLLATIYNPLEYCTSAGRKVSLFEGGKSVCSYQPINIKFKALFTWIVDVVITIYYVFRLHRRYDLYIGCDGLNAFLGIMLRKIGITKNVIFYTIDWIEKRFRNRFYNAIYHFVDRYAVSHSDYVWNISRRIVKIREEQGLEKEKNIFVPAGVSLSEVKYVSPEKANPKKFVFLGALEKSKGVELVINVWPKILERIPDAELIVIGKTPTGAGIKPYEDKLKRMKNVRLMGVLSHKEVLKVLPQYGVGLAPYSPDADSISRFSDPSRVKDYLACGLPVVITGVPEIAFEVQESVAGVLIDYSKWALVNAVEMITSSANYEEYRLNARELGSKFDWNGIFSNAMDEVLKWVTDNGPVWEYRERILKKAGVKIEPEMSVLDIGCGDGYDAVDFSKQAKSVVGLDVKPSPRWEEHKSERLRFIESDARSLPFKNETFNLVYMKDLVHHVNGDADRVLKEAKRVTKKGGQIVWIEANRYNPLSFLHMVLIKGHQHLPRHVFDKLAKECSKSVHFRRCEAHFFPIRGRKIRYLLYSFEDILEKIPLFERLLNYNIAIITREE